MRYRAFVDLEDQIDAVLIELFYLRRHGGGETPGAAVDFNDPLHIGLHARRREHGARFGLQIFLDLVLLERFQAFKHDAVDDRVFNDANDQIGIFLHDLHVSKQTRREQSL